MARLFQDVERAYEAVSEDVVVRLTGLSPLKADKVLRALRHRASIPRRQLENDERRAAIAVMRAHTPVRHLVSRHTRALLRQYAENGLIKTSIASREVDDRFIEMSEAERNLYKAVEAYIKTTYNQASAAERSAVGFVMTIYRRRLASSIYALRTTLERHLAAIESGGTLDFVELEEDALDDETADEILDAEELAELERQALEIEERADVAGLLERIRRCPPDSKLVHLKETVERLRERGYEQVMVFTQFGDTMDFLREELRVSTDFRVMCYSGRGGEVPQKDGGWSPISRDEAKRRFRLREADILLCTDAAAEGLNFQFCGALVNYDMPWNPMRVEQRIGRIDRLGQKHDVVRICNLHYEDTVETDVYRALGSRINLFQMVVGRLQPILAELPKTIRGAVLATGEDDKARRAKLGETIEERLRESESEGFDIDEALDDAFEMPERPPPLVTLQDLDRVIGSYDLMPPGTEVRRLGNRQYAVRQPGMAEEIRVTTDPEFFDEHADDAELWSPGNPIFAPPESIAASSEAQAGTSLKDILDR